MLTRLIYFVVCQLGWFVCVESAARGRPIIGLIYAIVAVGAHLRFATNAKREAKLLIVSVLIGGLWESALVLTGLLAYPNGILVPGTAPYWILALWALFAIQLNTLFVWLKGRWILAALLGAIAGPLSFRAGAALGAVRFEALVPAYVALILGWAALMPGLLGLAQMLDRTNPDRLRAPFKRAG